MDMSITHWCLYWVSFVTITFLLMTLLDSCGPIALSLGNLILDLKKRFGKSGEDIPQSPLNKYFQTAYQDKIVSMIQPPMCLSNPPQTSTTSSNSGFIQTAGFV